MFYYNINNNLGIKLIIRYQYVAFSINQFNEIPQSNNADQHMAPWGRANEH